MSYCPEKEPKPPLYDRMLATPREVEVRIDGLAALLIEEFSGRKPLFVALYRGAMPFSTRLMFAIAKQDPYFHPEMDVMAVSRYGSKLTGEQPRVVLDLSPTTDLTNRPIILLDDMVDKGVTLDFTRRYLELCGAEEVHTAVLVQRETEDRIVSADYCCFHVESDAWLTGMGLDDARITKEANRWAGYIAIANQ